jgi:hypothetical protein
MTANDYRGRFPVDVVTDCMGYSGKNAFVYAKPDGGDTAASWVGGFAYFVATDNIYTSSIKISNLLSDVDSSTIYAGSNDATLEKNAERVFSGVYLTYSGGKVYRQLQSTIDAYGRIDASIDMPDIKTAAAATALADRYLNDYSFEEDIINVALLMPADKVNLILEGHAVQIKQTHWLGYEDYVWRRVAQRTVSQTSNPAKYLVNLELRDPRLIVGGNGAIPIPAGNINNQLPPPAPSPGEAASESGIYLSVAPHLTANSPSDGTKLARFVVSATDSFAGTPIVMNAAPYTETGSFNVDSTAGDGSGLDIRGTIPATFFMSNLTIDTNTLYYVWIHYSDTLGGTAYSDGGTTMAVTVGHTLPTGTSLSWSAAPSPRPATAAPFGCAPSTSMTAAAARRAPPTRPPPASRRASRRRPARSTAPTRASRRPSRSSRGPSRCGSTASTGPRTSPRSTGPPAPSP